MNGAQGKGSLPGAHDSSRSSKGTLTHVHAIQSGICSPLFNASAIVGQRGSLRRTPCFAQNTIGAATTEDAKEGAPQLKYKLTSSGGNTLPFSRCPVATVGRPYDIAEAHAGAHNAWWCERL